MDLGSYLIQVRNERGYSQRDLAEKSGVSPAEISRVESGKRQKPSPAVLRAIADTLAESARNLPRRCCGPSRIRW